MLHLEYVIYGLTFFFIKHLYCSSAVSWGRLKNDMNTPFFTTGILYHVYDCSLCLYPHFPVVLEVVSCPHIWTILVTSCHSICSVPHPTKPEADLLML